MKVKKTVWSVHSKNAHTNEVISEALLGLHSQENFSTKKCSDGIKRELVDVPDYAFVARLIRSKKSINLDFEIYKRTGKEKPSIWTFSKKKKPTLKKLIEDGRLKFAQSRTK